MCFQFEKQSYALLWSLTLTVEIEHPVQCSENFLIVNDGQLFECGKAKDDDYRNIRHKSRISVPSSIHP